MKKMISILGCCIALFVASDVFSSGYYSLHGPLHLEAEGTPSNSPWEDYETVDEIIQYGYPDNGWWTENNTGYSAKLVVSFVNGIQSVDKIQFFSIMTRDHIQDFMLLYTTDSTPGLTSTFQPLTGLQFLNAESGTIQDNRVTLSAYGSEYQASISEVKIGFDPVSATALQFVHIEAAWGNNPDGAVIYEISIDGASANTVPEPVSMILMSVGVLGILARKIIGRK